MLKRQQEEGWPLQRSLGPFFMQRPFCSAPHCESAWPKKMSEGKRPLQLLTWDYPHAKAILSSTTLVDQSGLKQCRKVRSLHSYSLGPFLMPGPSRPAPPPRPPGRKLIWSPLCGLCEPGGGEEKHTEGKNMVAG